MRADDFNRQGLAGQPDFLKLHLRGHSVTFQAQPFAQGGQPDTVTSGKVPLGQLTLVETHQKSLPLFSSPTLTTRSSF